MELFLSPHFDSVVEGGEVLRASRFFNTLDDEDQDVRGTEVLRACSFFGTCGTVARDPRVGPAWVNGPDLVQDHSFRLLPLLTPPGIGQESERKHVCPCLGGGSGAQRPSNQKKHAPEKSFGNNSQKTKTPVISREESGRAPQQSCRTASCGSSGAVWRQSCDQGVSESCEIRTVVLNHGSLREGPLSRSQELKDSLLGSHRGSGNVIRPIPCGDPSHPPSVAAGGSAFPCCPDVLGNGAIGRHTRRALDSYGSAMVAEPAVFSP